VQDPGAVQRRERNQVERREGDVRDHERQQGVRVVRLGLHPARRHPVGQPEKKRAAQGQEQVGDRSRHRDDDGSPARILEVGRVDRGGLGASENQPPRQRHEARQQDRPEQVDVRDRIQREAAERLSGGVAQLPGHPDVGALVEHAGKNQDADAHDHAGEIVHTMDRSLAGGYPRHK
jgi:hypothetical protein